MVIDKQDREGLAHFKGCSMFPDESFCCISLSLSPTSGGPVCVETLWEPWPLLERQERKLQLHV